MDGQRSSEVKTIKHNKDIRKASILSSPDGASCPALFRYLLPALCHLSAEEGPRKVLLTLDTPALLVDFLSQCWTSLKGKSGGALTRDPSMETACSALLNFTVTEPERVRYSCRRFTQ